MKTLELEKEKENAPPTKTTSSLHQLVKPNNLKDFINKQAVSSSI
jgi:hypothetical protein